MQSERQSPDVGKLLTGLLGPGKSVPRRWSPVPSALRTQEAPAGEVEPTVAPGASRPRSTAVRVGGIVLGHVTPEDYRRIQTHLAAGGRVDITLICS